ncbi:MAG: recombinase family protein, partial [Lachnospiraceae bacterium]|nr:recombinase family protein [Lachnospiraceae bacterium]
MARKSRKNMPAAETSGNLTAQAVMELGQEVKPYRAAIYARLSFESEANKERDTVETQIAYIKDFIDRQDDMAAADVYADVSVTGTTFDRPEFDRMMQDIRAG